jgi:hypothetical protein
MLRRFLLEVVGFMKSPPLEASSVIPEVPHHQSVGSGAVEVVSAMQLVATHTDIAPMLKRHMEATERMRMREEHDALVQRATDMKVMLTAAALDMSYEDKLVVYQMMVYQKSRACISSCKLRIKHCERMIAIKEMWGCIGSTASGAQIESPRVQTGPRMLDYWSNVHAPGTNDPKYLWS